MSKDGRKGKQREEWEWKEEAEEEMSGNEERGEEIMREIRKGWIRIGTTGRRKKDERKRNEESRTVEKEKETSRGDEERSVT